MADPDGGLRSECAVLRSMIFQYAQLFLETRGSAVSGPGSAVELEPKSVQSKLEILRQAMGATALASPRSHDAADRLLMGPPPSFASPGSFHGLAGPGASPPTAPAAVNSPPPPQLSGQVQKEMARLRLRDGTLQRQVDEARAAAAEARASAAHEADSVRRAELQAVEAEAGLDVLRGELGEALRALEVERRAGEAARAQATEWRRQRQVAISDAAEAHASLLEARAGWARERRAAEDATGQLRMQAAALSDAQRRASEAEAQVAASEAEARRSLPMWHDQLTRAEVQLRSLGGQLKARDATCRMMEAELQSTRQALGAAEGKVTALRVAHGSLQLGRSLTAPEAALVRGDDEAAQLRPRGGSPGTAGGGCTADGAAQAEAPLLISQRGEARSLLSSAQAEAGALRSQLGKTQALLDEARSQLNGALAEARALSSQLHQARFQLNSAQAEARALLDETRSQLHGAQAEAKALRSQLDVARSQLDLARDQSAAAVGSRVDTAAAEAAAVAAAACLRSDLATERRLRQAAAEQASQDRERHWVRVAQLERQVEQAKAEAAAAAKALTAAAAVQAATGAKASAADAVAECMDAGGAAAYAAGDGGLPRNPEGHLHAPSPPPTNGAQPVRDTGAGGAGAWLSPPRSQAPRSSRGAEPQPASVDHAGGTEIDRSELVGSRRT